MKSTDKLGQSVFECGVGNPIPLFS